MCVCARPLGEYLWSEARMIQGSGVGGRPSVSPTVGSHSLLVMNERSKKINSANRADAVAD